MSSNSNWTSNRLKYLRQTNLSCCIPIKKAIKLIITAEVAPLIWEALAPSRFPSRLPGKPTRAELLQKCITTLRYLDPDQNTTQPIPTFQHSRTMALLVDKHRPRSLDALSYHPSLSDRLKALVSPPETPTHLRKHSHMLILELCRPPAEISPICSFTDLQARARRREFRRRSRPFSALVWRRSRSTLGFFRLRGEIFQAFVEWNLQRGG